MLNRLNDRFGASLFMLFGISLLLIGLMAMSHIVNVIWPFSVGDGANIPMVRDVALGQADSALLLQASNPEWILAFSTSILISVTGLTLPLVYYLNKRFADNPTPHFLIVLRQAMWIGAWVAFCVWLQMNRTLGLGVAFLVAGALFVFELMLQVRTRAAQVEE